MIHKPRQERLAALAVLLAIVLGCATPSTPTTGYMPGLGDLMLLTQIRHSKLWFAVQGGHWRLALYELEELQEGLSEAALLHPRHKDAPVPISDLIQKTMHGAITDLGVAIKARDQIAFTRAFDALSAGCNSCHQATNFGFAVVSRPSSNPYSNQSFNPERPPGP